MTQKAINLLPNTVAATGAGDPMALENGQKIGSAHVDIGTTATVKIQVSNDPRVETDPANAQWVDLTSGDTADAMYNIDTNYSYIRANVTAWTAGDVNVWVTRI